MRNQAIAFRAKRDVYEYTYNYRLIMIIIRFWFRPSLEANRSDCETEGLMWRTVVDRVKVDQRQLLRLPGANQEHGLGLALATSAAVHEDMRPGAVV